jgi:PAS domain-containing protein
MRATSLRGCSGAIRWSLRVGADCQQPYSLPPGRHIDFRAKRRSGGSVGNPSVAASVIARSESCLTVLRHYHGWASPTRRELDMTRDVNRRWNIQMGHLRSRVERIRRRGASEDVIEVLDQGLNLCESLERELAGAVLETQRAWEEANSQAVLRTRLCAVLPVACLLIDGSGAIFEANAAAASLLNTSQNHLNRRLLLHFTENREIFADVHSRVLRDHEHVRVSLTIRPRERASVDVDVTAMPWPGDSGQTSLWFLIRSERIPRTLAARQKKDAISAAS